MARTRLHNEDWGWETNCFVCEPKNASGLQIPFFHDDEAGTVIADFTLDDAFSGAPTFVHGGITLAVADEAMAWACIAVGHRWAVTTETTTRFMRPVLVDAAFTIEASIVSQTDTEIRTKALVSNSKGKPCAESEAVFTILGEAQTQRIAEAAGADDTVVDASYLKD